MPAITRQTPYRMVQIIEYLCHCCGQGALDITTVCATRRVWLCRCGVRWTGGNVDDPYQMQKIEERTA